MGRSIKVMKQMELKHLPPGLVPGPPSLESRGSFIKNIDFWAPVPDLQNENP